MPKSSPKHEFLDADEWESWGALMMLHRSVLQDLDAEVSSGTPDQFAAFWKREIEKYRKLISEAKIEA